MTKVEGKDFLTKSSPRCLSFFRLEAVDEANQHDRIVLIQLPHSLHGPVEKLGIDGFGVEELQRGHFKVITDPQKLSHGRQSLPGGNGLDVALVLPQLRAHLVLGNVLLQAQLRNAVPDVRCVHVFTSAYSMAELRCGHSITFMLKF